MTEPAWIQIETRRATDFAADGERSGNRLVSEEEHRRAREMKNPSRRAEFLTGRRLIRRMIGARLGLPPEEISLAVMATGQPRLAGPSQIPIHFSISHSMGLVACAVAGIPVGIDVEAFDRISAPRAHARAHYHPSEYTHLTKLSARDQGVVAMELWTLKEAFAKAIGLGLRLGLDATNFTIDLRKRVSADLSGAQADSRDWAFATFSVLEGFACSIAMEAKGRRARIQLNGEAYQGPM
ncbi:MAG: 4'-phosphopantetheinyl transferase superfamily protein [Pseudomonadota bacterium]